MIRKIRVGIKTDGVPILEEYDGFTLLKNMLIGDGFHWQDTMEVKLPGSLVPYEDKREKTAKVSLVNTVPIETYLESVVGSEMNPAAPFEFLKAHAVISRSWVIGKITGTHLAGKKGKINSDDVLIGWDDTSDHDGEGFDVCSDDHCQRYQGFQPISREAKNAIMQTRGQVLKSQNGCLVDARFSKCCGGRTELFETCWQSSGSPCIESVADPWCDLSGLPFCERDRLISTILKDYDRQTQNYGYKWEVHILKSDIREKLLSSFGRDIGEIMELEPLHRGDSGRIDLLRIYGSEGCLDLGKELWIRRLLSPSHLYSSAFSVKDDGKYFYLKGSGWGHGVGLCQIGAANMAANGYDYKSILSFYYPDSVIAEI